MSVMGVSLALLAAGCDEAEVFTMGTVCGTVTFKGQPVTNAMLNVYNKETAYANQGEIKDGLFEMVGELRTGTYHVFITRIPPVPGSPFEPIIVGEAGGPSIPEKYQFEGQSDLTIEVKEGENDLDIAVPEQKQTITVPVDSLRETRVDRPACRWPSSPVPSL